MKKYFSILIVFVIIFSVFSLPLRVDAASDAAGAGSVNITSGSLNVRSAAATNASIVSSLKKGSFVTLISKTGDWWRVEYAKNKYGYSHSKYISEVNGEQMAVSLTSGTLNVRSGAGTAYARIGYLSNGEKVIVLSKTGQWSKVLYHGIKVGYVSSIYLRAGSTGYGSVKLNVPSFKQSDSRWANVKIGSSGKTISQIGCATTGIAMMESYRTNKTIYPDAMSKKLKYTSSGSVYWPSDYKVVTGNSGNLKDLYTKLNQGKPILFGAKKSSGGQHWVVVTGFSGGNALTADKFLINDPGMNSRKTLQDFLKEYPNFYKYFYY